MSCSPYALLRSCLRWLGPALLVHGSGLAAPQVTREGVDGRVPPDEQRKILNAIHESENLIQFLGTRTPLLTNAALNLRIPDAKSVVLFADEVEVMDLAEREPAGDDSQSSASEGLVRSESWPVSGERA